MTVLITGGLGAIGSFVIRHFVERGYRPVVYDWRLDVSLIRDLEGRVELIQGDILDFPALARIVRQYGIQRIAHLAALMPPQAQADPVLGWKVNAGGTLNMLELARTFEIERLVLASSSGVYGPILKDHRHPTYLPLNEDHPKNPEDVYGVTKLASELMAEQYQRNYGLNLVALRFAATYGPGKLARHGRVGLHSRIIEETMAGIPVHIPQGGDQPDDFVYNRDVGLAVFLAVTKERVPSGPFNIGAGRLSTLKEMAEALSQLFPEAAIEIGPGLDYYGNGKGTYCRFDITRAQKELGYEPQYDVYRGIADYVEMMNRLGLKPAAPSP